MIQDICIRQTLSVVHLTSGDTRRCRLLQLAVLFLEEVDDHLRKIGNFHTPKAQLSVFWAHVQSEITTQNNC